nr:MAG TPA: hypothetical protein [Caudoviricetes sp.]
MLSAKKFTYIMERNPNKTLNNYEKENSYEEA